MIRRHLITAMILFLSPVIAFAAGPSTNSDKKQVRIKKCQDASGNWHYGDKADELCAKSNVIELDKSGVQRKVIARPKTEAELKAMESRRAAEEQAKKEAEELEKRDQQLLITYSTEEDITTARDRRLREMDTQIKGTENTIESLKKSLTRLQAQAAEDQRAGRPVPPTTAKAIANNESQISKHEANITRWRTDKENMKVQFQSDLERFREAKTRQFLKPAVPKSAGTAPAKK